MKLLLTLIVVTATINSKLIGDIDNIDYDPYTGPLAMQETNYRFEGHLVPYNSNSSLAARSRRAANDDNLAISIIRMQMIARLTNAIYLQRSLMDGKILSEKLISELLHFGPVTPTQIRDIDKNKVVSALQKLDELPQLVQKSDAIDRVETLFDSVGLILNELDGVEDITVWPGKDDYKADIKNLANGNVNLSILEKLSSSVSRYNSDYNVAKKYAGLASHVPDHYNTMEKLKKAFEGMLETGNEMSKSIPELFKFKNKKSATESFHFMVQVVNGVNKAINTQFKKSPNDFDELNKNVKTILTAANEVNNIKGSIEHVRNLLSSRSKKGNHQLTEFTFGLPDGTKDINRVPGYFKNSWFKEVVKSDSLAAGLKSLDSLKDIVNNIETTLAGQKTEAISKMFDFSNNLIDVFSGFDITKAEEIGKCTSHRSEEIITSSNGIVQLQTLAESIDNGFNLLKVHLDELKKLLDDKEKQDMLRGVINIFNGVKNDNAASLKAAIDQWLAYPNLKDMEDFVVKVSKALNKIDADIVKTPAADSFNSFASIDTFQNDVAKHSPFLNCLLKNKDTSGVIAVVAGSKKLRNLVGDQKHKNRIESTKANVKAVVDTKNDLTSLETAIKSIKGFKSTESDLLKLLPNPSIHSKVIGSATRGITSMKTAIDEKSNINGINKHVKSLKDEKTKHKNKLNTEDMTNLDKLVDWLENGNGKSFDNLFNELETWKSGIKKSNSTKLEDYAIVFLDAKRVGGIPEDLGKMSVSLGKLISSLDDNTNEKSLQEVQKALDYLDGIGSHKKDFDDSKKSLAQLDMFFANYAKQISVTTPPPIQLTATWTPAPVLNGAVHLETTTKWYHQSWVIPVGTVLTIGLVSLIFAIFGYKLYIRKKKRFYSLLKTLEIALFYLKEFYKKIGRCSKEKYKEFLKTNPKPKKPEAPAGETKEQADAREEQYRTDMKRWAHSAYLVMFVDLYTNLHGAGDSDMNEEMTEYAKQHMDETRHEIQFCEGTRVRVPTKKRAKIHFETDFFHGNYVKMFNNYKMILTQGPHPGTKTKKGSINKFWYVVKKEKTKSIVMLCNFSEFDVREGKVDTKCDKYFPTEVDEIMTFDHCTVKCTKVKVDLEDEIITRTLIVQYEGEPEQEVTHYQYVGWPDHHAPKSAGGVIKLLKTIRNETDPAIVHCSAGIGRSGSLAFIEYVYQAICLSGNGRVQYVELFKQLRLMRARSIQDPIQYAFCLYAIIEFLFDELDISGEQYAEQREQLATIRDCYSYAWQQDFDAKKSDGTKWTPGKTEAIYNKMEAGKVEMLKQIKANAAAAKNAKK